MVSNGFYVSQTIILAAFEEIGHAGANLFSRVAYNKRTRSSPVDSSSSRTKNRCTKTSIGTNPDYPTGPRPASGHAHRMSHLHPNPNNYPLTQKLLVTIPIRPADLPTW